eukprot:48934-Eustigmatos_ZCMA.PRE.1
MRVAQRTSDSFVTWIRSGPVAATVKVRRDHSTVDTYADTARTLKTQKGRSARPRFKGTSPHGEKDKRATRI